MVSGPDLVTILIEHLYLSNAWLVVRTDRRYYNKIFT